MVHESLIKEVNIPELVKALRICSSELNCGDCPLLYRGSCSSDQLMLDAVAAIEALQAQLPKRGEWIDTNGTKHKDADSPRYKALGNSIALPFWFYLLRRISATYERPATLGSLFDGIGGFPLCWERCNGKGTAVWASEIEEFPIAVTKIRFPDEQSENHH